MRKFYITSLLLSIINISIEINRLKEIKQCKYTSKCAIVGKELLTEVNFYVPPKRVALGELINNLNNSIKYTSDAKITKDRKGVLFKFFPKILGKYYLKFNYNLQCPEIITIKKEIGKEIMPYSIYLVDEQKENYISFNMYFELNTSATYTGNKNNEDDIQRIEMIENLKGYTEEHLNVYEPLNNCVIENNQDNEKKSIIKCKIVKENGFNEKKNIQFLGFYYIDRCGERQTLGFVKVITVENIDNVDDFYDKNNIKLSLLGELKPYNMRDYSKNLVTLITIFYSKNKQSDINFLYETVADSANKNKKLVYTFSNWEDDDYLTNYYKIKNEGKMKILIIEFLTENTYIGDVISSENFDKIISELNDGTIDWTSQNLMQKFLSLFHAKLNKTQQDRLYFLIGCVGFVFLVILRCYLYNKKRLEMEKNANFSINKDKKKVE